LFAFQTICKITLSESVTPYGLFLDSTQMLGKTRSSTSWKHVKRGMDEATFWKWFWGFCTFVFFALTNFSKEVSTLVHELRVVQLSKIKERRGV
jgi:hypothetical protein